MNKDEIHNSLYDLDSEYGEVLARALIDLNYVSDSPLNLSIGTRKQQQELKRVITKPLNEKELTEIINYMVKEMKDDYQYNEFRPIVSKYLNIAREMKFEEKPKPKCALIGRNGNIFNLMGIASNTLKNHNMREEAKEMCDRITNSKSYDEALNIISEYVEITDEKNIENDEEEMED